MSARNDQSDTLFPDETVTEQLAEALRLPLTDFVEVFGAPWRKAEEEFTDYDADPSGSGNLFGPWYLAGEPVQLMLRPRERDMVELAVPVGRGGGASLQHVWMPAAERLTLDAGPGLLESAPPVVADFLKRRRAGFRYCRYCRALTPPEERNGPDVCFGCAGAWLNIVYGPERRRAPEVSVVAGTLSACGCNEEPRSPGSRRRLLETSPAPVPRDGRRPASRLTTRS